MALLRDLMCTELSTVSSGFKAIALAQTATPHSTQFETERLNCADAHLALSNLLKRHRGHRGVNNEECQ